MASYTTPRSSDCPLWQQHGRDMVRSALWNNCHGDSMVGEGDGDSGDKKTRNGADVVM